MHGLRRLVVGCHRKPLINHLASLAELQIDFVPDYVVDDHADVVRVFRGWWITPLNEPIDGDRGLLKVLYDIQERFGLERGFTCTGLQLSDATPSGHGRALAKGAVGEQGQRIYGA
jgi:hypothetical protein